MNEFTAGQQKAIETLDKNLLVKAGAGAGKTRVLVERYIAILRQSAADVEGIVAITFTRKAAREMKERVRSQVRRLVAEAADGSEWRRWREVDRKLDSAPISTIHSLCSRLLRENPAEAGVDPEFSLLETAEEETLFDETWRELLDAAAVRQDAWLVHLLAVYSPAQIRQDFLPLFKQLYTGGLIGPQLESVLWPDAAVSAGNAAALLKNCYQELFRWIPEQGKLNKTQTALAEVRANWLEMASRIDQAADDVALLDALEVPLKGLRSSGDFGEAIRSRKAAAQEYRGVLLDLQVQRIAPDLCEWFRLMAQSWDRAKQQRGALTYDDLESGTERLLRNHPAVCERYLQRFRYLMVDECQDINERQRQIIYLLAGGQPECLQGNKLFAVGDAKQSIYRFRGADSGVFARVQADVCHSGGEVIELLDNFRSHRELVAAFNDFFLQLMPVAVCEEETGGADTVEYSKLSGLRGEAGQARVEMWVQEAAGRSSGEARAQEAAMIAGRIRSMVAESDGAVNYRDIVVLLRAFTHVSLYEAAFAEAGIPYYVAGGRGFAGRQEVADALALLRFLDNPNDSLALFATLRSALFQLSDETLLRLRRAGGAGGIWSGLAVAGSIAELEPGQLQSALRSKSLLTGWLARRGFLSPLQLLREAFDATGFDLLQLTQFMGDRRYANLLKLLELAAGFAETGGNLAEFLQYIEQRSKEEGEAEIDSETGDTVRIMTIHKSKGLEFPVVIVPELQRRFNLRSPLAVFLPGQGLGMKVPDATGKLCESARFRRICRRDHAQEKAELKRLLYVAMTRAERQVVLSAVVDQPKTEKNFRNAAGWLDWTRNLFGLGGAVQDWPETLTLGETQIGIRFHAAVEDFDVALSAQQSGEPESGGAHDIAGPLAAELERNCRPLAFTAAKPHTLSPAYLAEYSHCPRRYFYAHICRLPLLEARGGNVATAVERPDSLAPQQLGVVFHRFLELLRPPVECEQALAQAMAETLPPPLWNEAGSRLRRWATDYAGSALHGEICRLAEDRREWPFQYRLLDAAHELPAVWLSGQIDRLLFYPDGTLGIVDYKTDWLERPQLQEKAARYRLQIASYALAAEAIWGRPIRDARLYFARLAETLPIDLAPAALELARRELQSMAEFIRGHGQEADYRCNLSHCEVCPFGKICLRE